MFRAPPSSRALSGAVGRAGGGGCGVVGGMAQGRTLGLTPVGASGAAQKRAPRPRNLLLSPRMGEAGPRQPGTGSRSPLCNLLPCTLKAPSLSLHFLIGGCWEDENGGPQLPAAFLSPLLCSCQACDLSGPKFLPQPSSQICARKASWPRPLPRWTPSRCNPGQLVGD